MITEKQNLFEIYFDKELIFPYIHLNDFTEEYPEYNDANIYMIMLSNKLEITVANFTNNILFVKYFDVQKNKSFEISNIRLFELDLPNEYVQVRISNFNTNINVGITAEGTEYIKSKYPKIYNQSDFSKEVRISIYELQNISEQDFETSKEYEILYIGETKPQDKNKTIFDRLKKHEKVLEIYRDYNLKYRDKELMTFILHPKFKLINAFSPSIDVQMLFGNSEWIETDEIEKNVSEKDLRKITEAMLIYHFKPEYNTKFKETLPSINLKTYSKLVEAGVSVISVGINLFFQKNKNCIRLFTKTNKVLSKLRILYCDLENLYNIEKEECVSYEDMSDYEYWLIN